jgi:hypothetical protein
VGKLLLQRSLASLPSYVTSAPSVASKKLPNGVSVATEVSSNKDSVLHPKPEIPNHLV